MENEKEKISSWIRLRRSTFVNGLLEGGSVDDKIIENILEDAVWAPSHGLVQSWFFKVFTGKGLSTFFSAQQKIYKDITPADKFSEAKFNAFPDKVQRVTQVIAIIVKRDPKRRFPVQEDIVSVACALQNIYLSLSINGIGGYLSTGDLCYTRQMKDFLELDDEDTCLGFFMIGLPDASISRPLRKRAPLSEKMQWIRE